METSSSYYVRSRGRLSGPFDLATLRQMARTGKVSRFDHLSTDQSRWWPASELPGLFVAGRRRESGAVATAPADDQDTIPLSGDDELDLTPQGPRGIATAGDFFYLRDGVKQGPVSLAMLKALAADGTIGPDDKVCADGSEITTPAAQVPMLAPIYRGDRSPMEPVGPTTRVDYARFRGVNALFVPPSVRAAQFSGKVIYVVAGGLTLMFSLLPIAIFAGRPLWFWNAEPAVIGLTLYAMAASVALLVVAPLVEGLARPVVALALVALPMAISFLFAVVAAASIGGTGLLATLAIWGSFLLPLMLTGVNRLRPQLVKGGPPSVRAIQIALGTLTSLAAMSGVVLLVIAFGNGAIPSRGPFIIGAGFIALGLFTNFAAGLVGAISGRPQFSSELVSSSSLLLAVGSVFFVLSAIFIISDMHLRPLPMSQIAAIAYVALRSCVLVIAAAAWLCAAVRELLGWIYRGQAFDAA